MRSFVAGMTTTVVLVAGGVYLCLRSGFLNLRADEDPSSWERTYAGEVMDASTKRHAPDIQNPVPPTEANLREGMKLYQTHCAGCHGGAIDPEPVFGRFLYPRAPAFLKDAPDMPANENFYIIKHGIRWTGMAGWSGLLNDDQVWKLTTFLSKIDELPPSIAEEWKQAAKD